MKTFLVFHGLQQNMKLNANDIGIRFNTLIQSNKTFQNQINKLTNERDHYKHGCNLYKKELFQWKSNYMTLYSQINYNLMMTSYASNNNSRLR